MPKDLCLCHTKKKAASTSTDKPSFGMTPTIKLTSVVFKDDILQAVLYQKKAQLGGANQACVSYDNDKILKACFCITQLIYLIARIYQTIYIIGG